jgi:hypothetical protein
MRMGRADRCGYTHHDPSPSSVVGTHMHTKRVQLGPQHCWVQGLLCSAC